MPGPNPPPPPSTDSAPSPAGDFPLFNEVVTLRIGVALTENGLPRIEMSAPTPETEAAFERLSAALRHVHAAHQQYRRNRQKGGRIDRFSVVCLPERRNDPRFNP